jgi:hypothetical protein
MAREGGQVQLAQSDMFLALSLGKMGKAGFLHAPIKESHHLDMYIYILHFPTPNFSIMIQMLRIASAIKIVFQIC